MRARAVVTLSFVAALAAVSVSPPSLAVQIDSSLADNDIRATAAGDGAGAPGVALGNALSCCLFVGEVLFGSAVANGVAAFELPALAPGEQIANAVLTYSRGSIAGPLQYNVDLYGLDFRATGDVILDDYFVGALDSTGATLLLDDLLAQGTTPVGGRVSAPAAANAALTAYLNAQYAAGAAGGSYVFVRFSPDAYVTSPGSRLAITSGGNTTGEAPVIDFDIVPVATSPEPETAAILGLGLAAVLAGRLRSRRRRQAGS